MQRLPIDIGRRCTSEGAEDDVGATGVVAFLLKDVCHQVVHGVDQLGLARACSSMDYHQGWRGPGEVERTWRVDLVLLVLDGMLKRVDFGVVASGWNVGGGCCKGDEPLGIVDSNGERFLLPLV